MAEKACIPCYRAKKAGLPAMEKAMSTNNICGVVSPTSVLNLAPFIR